VTTALDTPLGTSTLTFVGTSGTLTHSVTATLAVSTTPRPGVVSVDFVGNGVSMVASEVAGVVPKSNWNTAAGATRATALALADEAGAPSGATITWTANNTWSTPLVDQPGNRRMMKGYLDTSSTSVTTITVAGLVQGTYDVYVYVDGDNA